MAANVLSNVPRLSAAADGEALPFAAVASPGGGVATSLAEACASVYEAHFAYVYRCLRHLGVREQHLDDAAQDVFVVVHDKLHGFDGRAAITTWLYAIVIRVARRYRERQGKAKRFESDEQLMSADSPELGAEARQKLALARRALDALDEDKREVFVLSEIEQMAAPEIASITGVPLNTVYSRLRAAKEMFASATRKLEPSHGRSR